MCTYPFAVAADRHGRQTLLKGRKVEVRVVCPHLAEQNEVFVDRVTKRVHEI